MRFTTKAILALVVVLALGTQVFGDVPMLIVHQGRLTTPTGDPVADGSYSMRFQIYDVIDEVKPIWDSDTRLVAVHDGLFSYPLGRSVALPPSLFSDNANLWLGVSVDGVEMAPRTHLTAGAYAMQAENVEWDGVLSMPAGFADGVDDVGGGDITEVVAGSGLDGGDDNGSVALWVATDGILTANIKNGEVMEWDLQNGAVKEAKIYNGAVTEDKIGTGAVTEDKLGTSAVTGTKIGTGAVTAAKIGTSAVTESKINSDAVTSSKIDEGAISNSHINAAAAISPSKIAGTVATLTATQTFTGDNTFDDAVYLGDSTVINANGRGRIKIGTGSLPVYYNNQVAVVTSFTGGFSSSYNGFIAKVYSGSNALTVTGAEGTANCSDATTHSYGYRGYAFNGERAVGVFGHADSAGTNWAGYFSGNVKITGTLTGGKNSTRIDHPLDPESKYLQQASVESPEMLSIHNGNVVTDAGGSAVVTLPEWFEAVNRDFRYQLTVIGEFAQAIIAEKISGNRFTIRTDKPNVEVSWQVSGVRNDPWAQAQPLEVEMVKPASEQGLYAHPEAYGQPAEKGIDYKDTHPEAVEQQR